MKINLRLINTPIIDTKEKERLYKKVDVGNKKKHLDVQFETPPPPAAYDKKNEKRKSKER